MILILMVAVLLVAGVLYLTRSDSSPGDPPHVPAPRPPPPRADARAALTLVLVAPDEVPDGGLTRELEPFRALLARATGDTAEVVTREDLRALGLGVDEAFRIADENHAREGFGLLLHDDGPSLPGTPVSAPAPRSKAWSAELTALFLEHAAASLEKQRALMPVLGDARWEFDRDRGTLTFSGPDGASRTCPVQILGTESEQSRTWRWGWANTESGLRPEQLVQAKQLRKLGEQLGVAELASPQFSLDQVNGDELALVASGVCGASGFYRAPYEGGALFLLFEGPALKEVSDRPLPARMAATFLALTTGYDVPDHRAALTAYARFHRLEAKAAQEDTLELHRDGAVVMTASFDEARRLSELMLRPS